MLILGCGNPDRGDDAAGRLVARRLREFGVEARENSGDALDLLDSWQGAGEIILVDAVVTGRRPGTVSVWDALAAPPAIPSSLGASHAFGWPEAVGLARMLGTLP